MIDTCEERSVRSCDTKGAYLNTDELFLVRFAGDQVDIMRNISREYEKYVIK